MFELEKVNNQNKLYFIFVVFLALFELLKFAIDINNFTILIICSFIIPILYLNDLKYTRIVAISLLLYSLFSYYFLGLKNNFATGEFIFLMLLAGVIINNRFKDKEHTDIYLACFIPAYITSGITKLYNSGINWVTDAADFKLILIKYSYLETNNIFHPLLALKLQSFAHFFPFVFGILLFLELTSFFMLVSQKLKWIYGSLLLGFHISVILILDLYFTSYILIHLLFTFKIHRLVLRLQKFYYPE